MIQSTAPAQSSETARSLRRGLPHNELQHATQRPEPRRIQQQLGPARATPPGAGGPPPIRSRVATAPDPDVERYLLNLQASQSPRTVDAVSSRSEDVPRLPRRCPSPTRRSRISRPGSRGCAPTALLVHDRAGIAALRRTSPPGPSGRATREPRCLSSYPAGRGHCHAHSPRPSPSA